MTFLVTSKNVLSYLNEKGITSNAEINLDRTKLKPAKNFNLLLNISENFSILVKQGQMSRIGKIKNEFKNDYMINEFAKRFSQIWPLSSWISEIIHYDPVNSIILIKYLDDYLDLSHFYVKNKRFSPDICTHIGGMLAILHRETYEIQEYQDFFSENEGQSREKLEFAWLTAIEKPTPTVFGAIPSEGLKFLSLYQRYKNLGKAVSELVLAFAPTCLAHNDLKLNNILIQKDWDRLVEKEKESVCGLLRFIDWEFCGWGDPAFDLGTLIASYLQIWLNSLVVGKEIELEDSLRMAAVPLNDLQPSITRLITAYLENFPEIRQRRPDFLKRVIQFTGLALIQQIQATLQYQKFFGNTGICTLQVAKKLLCQPEQSITTLFGTSADELYPAHSLAKHYFQEPI